jgi:hypothetical protein
MLRALAPWLLLSCLISAAGGVAYDAGAGVGAFYAAIVLAVLVVIPPYIRWDRKHYP